MRPEKIFLGMTLYDILISVGIIVCFFVFGHLADKRPLKVRLQKMMLINAVVSIALGFGSAILFQALYNIEDSGVFEIVENTGATFYGGLVGGATVFLIVYFAVGALMFKNGDLKGYHKSSFFDAAACVAPAIAVAHGFGRLGCLTAGCCHGAPTDAWFGIMMYGDMGYQRYVPVQLFEACFLFLLFATLFFRARAGKSYNLPIYMATYGIWRFLIEFARGDYRGNISFTSLTPSQFIAVLMIIGGVAVFFLEKILTDRKNAKIQAKIESTDENEAE